MVDVKVEISRNRINRECSCCFKYLADGVELVPGSEEIKQWMLDLTQIELKDIEYVCLSCFNDIKYCIDFRNRLIQSFVENQRKLLKSTLDVDRRLVGDNEDGLSHSKSIETSSNDPLVDFVDVKVENIDENFANSIENEETASRVFSLSDVEFESTDLAECSDCLQLFPSTLITRHINEVHLESSSVKTYSCDKCKFKSTRPSRLEIHCEKFHQSFPPNTERRSNKAEFKKRKQCPACGIFVKNLSEHQKMVHNQVKRFLCDYCNYSCYFKTKIDRHIQRHIPKHLREKFPCDFPDCNFFATRKDALKSHVLTMHQTVREKVCLCIECGKSFYNRSQLNIHVKAVHEKIKNHLCNLCGKSFFNIKDMEMHVKRHGVKDTACEVCGNLFYCSLDLKRHLKIHSEPTISCDVPGCQKRFYTNSKLKMHVKIRHEGAKDYFCDYCSTRFSQYNNLKRHVNSVHKSLRISCLIPGCNYSVARKDKYKNHLTSQHKFLDDKARESILKNVKFE